MSKAEEKFIEELNKEHEIILGFQEYENKIADLEAKLAESEDCKNMLYKCLTEKDIEIETKKEEIAELQKQLEEKEKEIEKLREWLSQCEADRKSEQEKKNLAFKKWKESKEDALCLQQIYSRLGVEAYGEDIQEQAIKRIDAFKAINCPPELIGKDVYLIGADEFHEYILYKNALPVEVSEGNLLTKEQIAQLQARDDQLREVERKAYQEGLLQKQFDKDAEIMLLEQEIEDLKRSLMEKNS